MTVGDMTGYLSTIPGRLDASVAGDVTGTIDLLSISLGTLTSVDETISLPVDQTTLDPLAGMPALINGAAIDGQPLSQPQDAEFEVGGRGSDLVDIFSLFVPDAAFLPLELDFSTVLTIQEDYGDPSGIGSLQSIDIDVTIDATIRVTDIAFNLNGFVPDAVDALLDGD